MLKSADIVVIGGGSAGLCAALAAARDSCDVMLVEKSNSLGGMGSLALVHTFCGLYMPDVSEPPRMANPGLPQEIESEMRRLTGQEAPVKMGKVYVLPQQPDVFDRLAKKLVKAEGENLKLELETECTGVSRIESGGFMVHLNSAEKEWQVECKSVVDCSANATVSGYLGVDRCRAKLRDLQKPAFIFSLENVADEAFVESFRMRLALDIVHAVKEGTLPSAAMGVSIRKSPQQGQCFVSIDLDIAERSWDPSSVNDQREVRAIGENLAQRLTVFLRGNYSSFSSVSSPCFPTEIGIREGYRWIGRYTLTEEDLVEGRTFEDAVANATWPIELRETVRGPRFKFFQRPLPSQIPLRSIVSREVPGVFFAGRCLSASHEALASVRVMGTCFATGQAAGLAASIYMKGESDVLVQARLIQEKIGFKSFLQQ